MIINHYDLITFKEYYQKKHHLFDTTRSTYTPDKKQYIKNIRNLHNINYAYTFPVKGGKVTYYLNDLLKIVTKSKKKCFIDGITQPNTTSTNLTEAAGTSLKNKAFYCIKNIKYENNHYVKLKAENTSEHFNDDIEKYNSEMLDSEKNITISRTINITIDNIIKFFIENYSFNKEQILEIRTKIIKTLQEKFPELQNINLNAASECGIYRILYPKVAQDCAKKEPIYYNPQLNIVREITEILTNEILTQEIIRKTGDENFSLYQFHNDTLEIAHREFIESIKQNKIEPKPCHD